MNDVLRHLDEAYCRELLPRRPADGHKGTFGTLVCICGSLDYAGAAILSGTAGMRGGAGLVALAVPARSNLCLPAAFQSWLRLACPRPTTAAT